MYWNGEQALRSYWNDAVIALANALGRENVFVTVYENGSWDDSKGALRELDMALAAHQIRRNITLSETTHLDEISVVNRGSGWVDTPRGRRELRRIPYLSRLRNWTLESLQELARQGERFDKVLFLNDVMFEVEDVFRLLHTNNGDFAAACSLDFSSPPQLYDTFALRDAEGHEPLMQTWPARD
ncbi:CAP59-mtransfer domain containing protein [Pyrenophora tritici-repentis]|uniref:Polysaccharide export protein n=1 Tax=Pyrenophora tritici-repentis TaxID=45151 RepID=A0A922N4E2_9PLEO|nr:Polysaccharide export protein [Pyrenophora tritici-repentis]KAI1563329.1 Polysaccharide export protein CAP59 [Pyrenophora tritici-repentis]KAI1575079.1 Polysaccharide export protein CAP59 [Pyrenophora tritici-repentis]PZD23429.1 CAP59-mtransfer domain containing protein [Pyrenophora tritici-repentis]